MIRATMFLLSLLFLVTLMLPSAVVSQPVHTIPAVANTSDLGSSTKPFRNVYATNVVAASTNTSSNVAVTSALNVTGTTTLNAVVGNSTVNVTGLLTTNNATANGTVNASVLIGKDPVGYTVAASNATLTAANVGLVFVNGMAGNRTLELPSAATVGAGAWFEICDVAGNIANNGNLTVNATGGGSEFNGATTFSVNNVTFESAKFISDGTNYSCTVRGKTVP